jgi:nucleotide-binding universal stress UspA family protein
MCVVELSLIVCPVDFSPSGEAALRRALALAQSHEAELHVLHVRPGRTRPNAPGTMSVDELFRRRLVEFIASSNPAEGAVTPVIPTGDPIEAVTEYARVKSADLVVVGQNGRRGSRFWPAGVLATDIARTVASPTLTVSKEAVPGTDVTASFDNILCAIDFSAASLRALTQALTLAQQSSGRITLLHVLEGFPHESVHAGSRALRLIGEYRAGVDSVKRELRALVPPDALNWCKVATEVVSGIPHDAIVVTARARKADLVVIGRPQRTRLDRIVMASTVSGVLRRARCPVLAVPGPSDVTDVASKGIGADRYDDEAIAPLTLAATDGVAAGSSRDIEAL